MTKKGVFFCQNRCKNNKFRAKKRKKTQNNQNVKNQGIVNLFENISLKFNMLKISFFNSKKF